MKKITESQLKDKVNSLREYLTAYENENQLLAENPYAGADAEKFARLSPADQAWYTKGGGKPDLNDPIIASRAPNKGKLGPAKTRGFSAEPTPSAPAVNAMGVAPTANVPGMVPAPALTAADQEDADLGAAMRANAASSATTQSVAEPTYTQSAPAPGAEETKIARFKELLAKAKAPAAATSPYAFQAKGVRLNANESTDYFLKKLRLIESTQLNEDLTADEQKELDGLYAELGNTEQPRPEVAELINQYNVLKAPAPAAPVQAAAEPVASAAVATPVAPPAPAVVTQLPPLAPQAAKVTGPVTWKQIYELNKDIIGANPNLIKPGQQLKMPDGSTYPVQAGDNLSKIAKKAGGGQGAKVAPVVPATGIQGTDQGTKTAPAGRKELPNFPVMDRDPNGAYRGDRSDATVMDPKQPGFDFKKASAAANATKQPATESVGYNELQRIVSLVNHR